MRCRTYSRTVSVRSAERITGIHRDTILRLLVLAGDRCLTLFVEKLVNLNVTDVQADEIWGFIQKKEGRKRGGDGADLGDTYFRYGWKPD